MITRFQISTRRSGEYRTIKVLVYDDLAEMKKAAKRRAKWAGESVQVNFDESIGVAHRFQYGWITSNGGFVAYPGAGIIRLWRGAIGAGLIAHEVTHVAIHIYDQDCRTKRGEPLENINNEEILCHLVGELNSKLCAALWKRKFYKKEESEHGE